MAEKLMKYADAVKKFDPVIGLETHVELSTTTKLFCPAEVHFGGEPNTQLTPVSLGLPGSLPVVNKTAVDYAIKLGLALHCEIAEWSQFARKNYFYPDMPRDYQISQYDKPTNGNGYLDVELEDGTIFRVPIERAHIEDDAGKNTHVGGADGRIEGADHSLVDYNRAGVPLIEIVTKPIEGAGDRAPEIAGAYMRAIRDIVRALNISHARMEQGNMRADVNVSLRNSPSELQVPRYAVLRPAAHLDVPCRGQHDPAVPHHRLPRLGQHLLGLHHPWPGQRGEHLPGAQLHEGHPEGTGRGSRNRRRH